MHTSIQKGIESSTSSLVSKVVLLVWDRLKLSYNKYMVPVPEHFIQYTTDCYERFSKIKCLARSQTIIPLKKLYVPLTIFQPNRDDTCFRVEKYVQSFFDKYRRMLIVDTAGMGKSTLVKKLFLDIIDEGDSVPLFIELRRLSRDHSVLDEIMSQLSFFDKKIPEDLLYSFIRDGHFTFILDGYDEISLSDKSTVTSDLQDFISHASNNSFIITSRQEVILSSFEGFETFNIKPLTKEEAFILLRNYDDDNKEISDLLISKLKVSNDFDEFLGNPLLTSMLLTAFSFKNEIPRQKHIFYRTVFDAYFNSHDLTKGGAYQHEKHSGLESDSFHKVLRYIGAVCLKEGKIEFLKDEFINIISRALILCPEINCSADDLFMDLIEVVPLFVQDGVFYRWAHKSLFEYFAAQNIYRDMPNKEKVLLSLSSSERIDKYINLLDLYYEIDFTTFRRSIIKNLFQDLVRYIDNNNPNSPLSLRRYQCTFTREEYYFVYSPESKKDFGRIAQLVHSSSKHNSLYFTNNTWKTLFVFRNGEDNAKEVLIKLLFKKGHSCVFSRVPTSLSFTGLIPEKVYVLDDNSNNPLNKGVRESVVTELIESLDKHIDYQKAKDELLKIEEDIRLTNAFEEELFS